MRYTPSQINRRRFIKRSSMTAAAGTSLASLASAVAQGGAHAAGDDEIKIGLIGCGGRGSGAASQALQATKSKVKLWAMGDLFANQVESSHKLLSTARRSATTVPPLLAVETNGCSKGAPVRRLRLLPEGDRQRSRFGDPRHATALPPGAFRGRGESGQARVHGETGRGGSTGYPPGDRGGENRQGQETLRHCRHAATPPEPLPRDPEARPGRRHRRYRAGQCYWNMGPLWVEDAKRHWAAKKDGTYKTDMDYQCRNWLSTPGCPATTSASSTCTTSISSTGRSAPTRRW